MTTEIAPRRENVGGDAAVSLSRGEYNRNRRLTERQFLNFFRKRSGRKRRPRRESDKIGVRAERKLDATAFLFYTVGVIIIGATVKVEVVGTNGRPES